MENFNLLVNEDLIIPEVSDHQGIVDWFEQKIKAKDPHLLFQTKKKDIRHEHVTCFLSFRTWK